MVTSHTEALNKLYGPPDHLCESHTIQTQRQAQKQRPFTGSQIHWREHWWRELEEKKKTKRKYSVASLTCVEERVINTSTAREENDWSYLATAVFSHVMAITRVLIYKCLTSLYRNLGSYKYLVVILGTTTKMRVGGVKGLYGFMRPNTNFAS